jgi:hypothetical protein
MLNSNIVAASPCLGAALKMIRDNFILFAGRVLGRGKSTFSVEMAIMPVCPSPSAGKGICPWHGCKCRLHAQS